MESQSSIPWELIQEFQKEAQAILKDLELELDQCEEDSRLSAHMASVGQRVDRIMGAAQSLALAVEKSHPLSQTLHQMGEIARVGKALAYKASQLTSKDEEFWHASVAFLQDTVEFLQNTARSLNPEQQSPSDAAREFDRVLRRLNWLVQQFPEHWKASIDTSHGKEPHSPLSQDEINELLKRFGVG